MRMFEIDVSQPMVVPKEKKVGITKEQMDRVYVMMEQAAFDSVVEAECMECGDIINAEPDAATAWCECCDKLVKLLSPAGVGLI